MNFIYLKIIFSKNEIIWIDSFKAMDGTHLLKVLDYHQLAISLIDVTKI